MSVKKFIKFKVNINGEEKSFRVEIDKSYSREQIDNQFRSATQINSETTRLVLVKRNERSEIIDIPNDFDLLDENEENYQLLVIQSNIKDRDLLILILELNLKCMF